MSEKRKQIIIITDGDSTARAVVERVASNIGGRCISLSAGNPTETPASEIVDAIKRAEGDPVLVMVDDGGKRGSGPGERILAAITKDAELEIIGAIAVASHTNRVEGVPVTASVDRDGHVIAAAVDKEGAPQATKRVEGDTVDALNRLRVPVVIGVGDLGKMHEADCVAAGARVTTQAVQEILRRAGSPPEERG